MDNSSKIPEEFKVEPKTEFGKKLDNFWYYHKWKVIAAIFVVFVLAICVYSCITRPKNDVTILYAGPYSSYDGSVSKINDALTSIMPESVGKDGVAMNVLEIYNEEQIQSYAQKEVEKYLNETKEDLSEEEKGTLLTRQKNSLAQLTKTNFESFSSNLQMGNYVIYLIDPSLYEQYKDIGVFAKLQTVFGDDIPESAYSDDAILLSKTNFYKSFESSIGQLPDDTLLCLRVEPLLSSGCGNKGTNTEYEKAVEMFIRIVNYK